MSSKLLVHSHKPDEKKCTVSVTPQSAGWGYIDFNVRSLAAGEQIADRTGPNETCLVLVSGKARIIGAGQDFGVLGERMDPFSGAPWSVYLPSGAEWRVEAETAVELAVCGSPAKGKYPARVIPPQDVGELTRAQAPISASFAISCRIRQRRKPCLWWRSSRRVVTGPAIHRTSTIRMIFPTRPISRKPITTA